MVLQVSGHAYFSQPVPRNAYPVGSAFTNTNGVAQGPVFALTTDAVLSTVSPTTLTTCNATVAAAAPNNPKTNKTYDPGFSGVSPTTWFAGSAQTVSIFVSESHQPENQTIHPTDGFQILYRDGTTASQFYPLSITVTNIGTGVHISGIGPFPTIQWVAGQTVAVGLTVPTTPTLDGVFQFLWRNNEVNTGVLFLSCADVNIVSSYGIRTSSASIGAFSLVAIIAVLLMIEP